MICLSLKWRVSLWVSAVLVAVIATVSVVAYVEFEESHLRELDQTLLAMANGILASVKGYQNPEELREEVRAVTANSGLDTASFPYRIWMEDSPSDLLASDAPDSERGRWLRELPDQDGLLRDKPVFVDLARPHDEYRAVWLRRDTGNGIVNIAVAGSSHFTYHELHEFLRLLLVLGSSLVFASVVAVFWTVRCGLLPINATAKQLQAITHPNVRDTVFDEKTVPNELRPFVRALDDMLDRLNSVLRQQRQFTSDAAHELRTPLTLAKSTLQTIQMRERQPDEYQRAICDALEDLARMERLMEQLLVLARMDEVGGPIPTGEVQLEVLLGELADNYQQKAGLSGGKVVFENSSAATVRADPDELARLFGNVLDNAVKYGPPGGTVRINLKSGPEDCATVCIRDEGGSIPPETVPHLFDRFYRVDRSRSSSTGGAGLGLAIAQEIAHRYNGDITITSNPESGTLVTVRLGNAQEGRLDTELPVLN